MKGNSMQMHKPAHPGEVLREMYLIPLDITITEASKALAVTRKSLSELINGHSGISTTMALRLAKALNTTPELWLNLQHNYDIWNTKKKFNLTKVKPLTQTKAS